MNPEEIPESLREGITFRWFLRVVEFIRPRLEARMGRWIHWIVQWKEGFLRLQKIPLKSVGVVLTSALLTNLLLSGLLHKEAEPWGVVFRWALLFLGLGMIRSTSSWEEAKEESFFLRLFSKRTGTGGAG